MTNKEMFEKAFPHTKQIGGKHYKKYNIQPYDFISKNNLSFYQSTVIKYFVRYLEKGDEKD